MYVIVWEFVVRRKSVRDFVAAYKSDGVWARLFAKGEGYIVTELLVSAESDADARYVTIDRWRSAEDFAHFQAQFGEEYKKLDTQLDDLTVGENRLGNFLSKD